MLAAGRPERLASLRRCVSAGEHLPAATWQAFHDATGIRIIDGLGSTEMLHIFVSAADDDIRPGSTGRAVPGYRAVVLGDDGSPLPPGQVGRLAVRGPTGCRYLADDRQAVYVQDGWNVTGDTYVQDEDGYLWYQARSDDMIISAGYNIAAPEVEEALISHPDVTEVAVIGTPDTDRGQLVTAFVVLGEDVVADPDAGARAAGPRQGGHRAVQVPAAHRVRGRAAAHQHRQAAALPPAAVAVRAGIQTSHGKSLAPEEHA